MLSAREEELRRPVTVPDEDGTVQVGDDEIEFGCKGATSPGVTVITGDNDMAAAASATFVVHSESIADDGGFASFTAPGEHAAAGSSAGPERPSTGSGTTPLSPRSASGVTTHISLCSMIEYGVASEQGSRRTMEDRHSARAKTAANSADVPQPADDDVNVDDIPEDQLAQGVPFFGVYDGHGGTQCAAFLRKKLEKLVLSHPNVIDDPEAALTEAITVAEDEFLSQFKEDSSGSTLAIVLIVGDTVVTANVGDTEIVLCRCRTAVLLSEKHSLKGNDRERARVTAAGGRVFQNRVAHPLYNPSVLSLGVSRAVGDSGFKVHEYTQGKPSGVIATPYTSTTAVAAHDDDFILIGCDGVWDVMNYQEAVDFCLDQLKEGRPSAQAVSAALVARALDLGSSDNVTAMFITLRSRPSSASHRPPSAVHRRWANSMRIPPPVPVTPEIASISAVSLENTESVVLIDTATLTEEVRGVPETEAPVSASE